MKVFVMAVLAAFLLAPAPALAGRSFEGWGENPNDAMKAALDMAESQSPARCLCKDWAPDMERDCREAMGGYICKACGSNHKGSCSNRSDIDKLLGR